MGHAAVWFVADLPFPGPPFVDGAHYYLPQVVYNFSVGLFSHTRNPVASVYTEANFSMAHNLS